MEREQSVEKILGELERTIIGKREVLEYVLTTLLAGGHLLLEDVPGVGKTTLALCLARALGLSFGRIQFTPDTLPGDVLGVSIYDSVEKRFRYQEGVVMNQILLADEINRTSPKTQASLLEAMEERQVTVDGITHELPDLFMVIATQNPIEYIGTYQLPEAQLDRFFMRISMGYPALADEKAMIHKFLQDKSWKKTEQVMDSEELKRLQAEVKAVFVKEEMIAYIMDIISKTRGNEYIYLGASPRAAIALTIGAQAAAYLKGRDYVRPEDIKWLVKPMLSHRLVLSPEARAAGMNVNKILDSIMVKIKVPV